MQRSLSPPAPLVPRRPNSPTPSPTPTSATTASLANFSDIVLETLKRFSSTPTSVVSAFSTEIATLRKFLDLIERVRRARFLRLEFEDRHWRDVNALLERCRSTFARLFGLLADLEAGDPEAPADAVERGSRWNGRVTEMEVLRGHVVLYTKTLQVALQTINLVHQWKSSMVQDGIYFHMKDLTTAVQALKDEVVRRKTLLSSKDDFSDEGRLLENVQRCVASAEDIMQITSSTIYEDPQSPPVRSPATGENQSVERRIDMPSPRRKLESPQGWPDRNPQVQDSSKHQGSTESDSDSDSDLDPEPDFEDDDLPEEVYIEIISRLQEEVQAQMAAGDYERAEMTQKRLMSQSVEREQQTKVPFGDQTQMNETLAEIYLQLGQLDKAKRILNRLLTHEKEETDRKWRLYHSLATVYKEQGRLPEAVKFAKRAYGGREKTLGKGSHLVSESVDLLIQIYVLQGEIETAEALRKIYRSSNSYAPSSPARQTSQHPTGPFPPPGPPPQRRLPPSPFKPPPLKVIKPSQEQAPPPYQSPRNSRSPRQRLSPVIRTSAELPGSRKSSLQLNSPLSPGQATLVNDEGPPQTFKNGIRWTPDSWNVDPSGINAHTKSGETPLIAAITQGDEELVKFMVQRGAQVEARCVEHTTPLMHAVIHGSESISQFLLQSKAKVDATTSGWTPLHKAIEMSSLGMAKLLIDHGADLEARSPKNFLPRKSILTRMRSRDLDESDTSSTADSGWTVLLRAATSGHQAMVRLLLQSGADVEAKNSSNLTPLMCAAEGKYDAIVDLLLASGANVNVEDEFGWKPLHRAIVSRGGEPCARLLVDHGADVNARCLYRRTPLHHAIEKNDESMAIFLLNAGADIEARDIAERTPLHTAIECRFELMVRLLLDSGADAAAMDKGGHDALAAANHTLRRSPEIIALLIKHKKKLKRMGSERNGSVVSNATVVGSSKGRRGSLASTSTGLTKTVSKSSGKEGGGGWWSRKQKGRLEAKS